MEVNLINTKELIETIITNSNKWVEARLRFGNISATHFLLFEDNKLYDEGIDGEERVITPADFIKYYQNFFWKIDNVV
jgi:hypothetical protein